MRVMIVDKDADFRYSVAQRLRDRGCIVADEADLLEALDELKKSDVDVVLVEAPTDHAEMPAFLTSVTLAAARCAVVVLGSDLSNRHVVQAVKAGAYEVLSKPCVMDELWTTIQSVRMSKRGTIRGKTAGLFGPANPADGLVGRSAEMCQVREQIRRCAVADRPVLITGETGTGKELVAKAVHFASNRRDGPLVTVNCAALPESLLESELFGHVKGAFTGADSQKHGLFAAADGGTLFIDEFGDMAPSVQAKLLRVLEHGTLRQVGSTQERHVDVRLVTATNRDLQRLVQHGRFRSDLYYRVHVLSISLPALRNRRDDIPVLVDFFLNQESPAWSITDTALRALCEWDWPGNVRELKNVIERATVLAEKYVVRLSDLPAELQQQIAHPVQDARSAVDHLADVERRHVARILEREQWNRNRTAKALGISRRSLYRLIQKYHLQPRNDGIESAGDTVSD